MRPEDEREVEIGSPVTWKGFPFRVVGIKWARFSTPRTRLTLVRVGAIPSFDPYVAFIDDPDLQLGTPPYNVTK